MSFAQDISTGPPPPQPIVVMTDKSVYVSNETVIISGRVNQVQLPSNSVSIEIIDPLGGKTSAIVPLSENGSYSYNLDVSSALRITGEYRAIATYGGHNSVTLFMIIAHPYILTIEGKSHPIDYTIESGLLTNITANVQEKSLALHVVNSTKTSKLTISLPRDIIDSQGDAGDMPFTVFANDRQVQFNETKLSSGARTLEINLPYEGQANPTGTWNVKIIGTKIIPEFGSLTLAVLAVGGIVVSMMLRNGVLGFYRFREP
ncbi:hypothetical protein [Nitrososphaera viennensis]|nr:hypothetical protein [Nitrososphaera viennensis]UVS68475.1 hypothetical protein NWT39_11255 [Nitrososphaera viennensis]